MSKQFYKELGEILRDARKDKKMSQQDIADHLHIARQNVGTYERGVKTLDLDAFLKICEILQIDYNEVIQKINKLI